ncbi:MAG: nitrogen fixation negative regulator NifL [Colwellia sp.]
MKASGSKIDTVFPSNELNEISQLCCDSLQRITQVVDHIPMAITITNPEGDIQYCNAFFSQVTGYALSELLGKSTSVLSYKTTPSSVYSSLWREISQGNIWQGKLVNKRKNNERYLAEIKIVPLRDSNNDIVFYLAMQKDISDSHIIKVERSNQEKTIGAILNTIPSALALMNTKQKVLLDNLAYKTLATDFKQEPATLIIEQIKLQLDISDLQDLSALKHAFNKKINVVLDSNRQKRWFSCRLLNLEVNDIDIDTYFAPKTTDLLLLTITEFTHEKIKDERQRIAELQILTAETEMVHAMQETMHAVLHQLHTPINMIESAVNLINQQGNDNSGLSDVMNRALNAGNDALTQLRNALPERSPEARQLTNINQVVHDLTQMTTHKLLQHSIEFNLSLKGTLPSINAQPSRLRLAFKKLLDNAIDSIVFNQCDKREIIIKTQIENEGIHIIFEDSGIGIPKDLRFKVFQPFYSTKPHAIEGTRGIGLSIVQQVINEHSGTVEFQTSSLGGTRVCVFLPKLKGM